MLPCSQLLEFCKDAFEPRVDRVLPFFFEMSTHTKSATANCDVLAKCCVKFFDVVAYSVTGAGSGDPYKCFYRRSGLPADVGAVDVRRDVVSRTFTSLQEMYDVTAELRSTRPMYMCTNVGNGSRSFIVDRPITHIIPGTMVHGSSDLNQIMQILGRAFHCKPYLPMMRDPDGTPYAFVLAGTKDMKVLQSYELLTNLAFANMRASGVCSDDNAVYLEEHEDTDIKYLVSKCRVGHVAAEMTKRIKKNAKFVPGVELVRVLGDHAPDLNTYNDVPIKVRLLNGEVWDEVYTEDDDIVNKDERMYSITFAASDRTMDALALKYPDVKVLTEVRKLLAAVC